MTVRRMDHVGIIVDDLEAATAFFVALGLKSVGEWSVEGEWAGRVIGLEDIRSDVVMLATPDGHGQLELSKFHSPPATGGDPDAPSNALGIRHITFAVDDLDATLANLGEHGAELVGNVENYENLYRLCYIRGPEGIIVELAEQLA